MGVGVSEGVAVGDGVEMTVGKVAVGEFATGVDTGVCAVGVDAAVLIGAVGVGVTVLVGAVGVTVYGSEDWPWTTVIGLGGGARAIAAPIARSKQFIATKKPRMPICEVVIPRYLRLRLELGISTFPAEVAAELRGS